jgi:hypothetical protein
MDEDIVVIDNPQLLELFAKAPEAVMPYLVDAMTKSVLLIQDDMAQYPPETAANAPGRFDRNGKPMGYYERGRGSWYPIVRHETLGKTGVARGSITEAMAYKRLKMKAPGTVVGYKLAGGGKSEQLGKHWTHDVSSDPTNVYGVVGNNVSYAIYVQGPKQSEVMAGIGWLKDIVEVQNRQGTLHAFLNEAVQQAIDSLR